MLGHGPGQLQERRELVALTQLPQRLRWGEGREQVNIRTRGFAPVAQGGLMIAVDEEEEDERRMGLSVPVFFNQGAVTLYPRPDLRVKAGQPRHHEGVVARRRGALER